MIGNVVLKDPAAVVREPMAVLRLWSLQRVVGEENTNETVHVVGLHVDRNTV